MTDMTQRLSQQLAFVVEVDKLKSILRQTTITCAECRRENDAEHSWHIALMASLLAEYATAKVDVGRVMRMLLLHDIVEIDAGDTFAYDVAAYADKEEREVRAADRIFGLLPTDQGTEFRALWDEFEAGTTEESRFANALDRIQPLLLNFYSGGGSWGSHRVTRPQVLTRMDPVRRNTPELWPVVLSIVDQACSRGWIVTENAVEPETQSASGV